MKSNGTLPFDICAKHTRTALCPCLTFVKLTLALLACSSAVTGQSLREYSISHSLREYNITEPLRVCVASTGNSGLRCNGAPTKLRHAQRPQGPVPPEGWCPPGVHFCGNDVDIWSEIADRLGLINGTDFDLVCFGEAGFDMMIATLAEETFDYGICDIGASGITASSEREAQGISFSRPTHRSSLAVLVHAPFKQRGKWAFFEPLHLHVWVAVALTVVVTPLIVFFFEAVFNKSPFYAEDGKLSILRGLRECVWHSVCHTLSIDVFRVESFPARIVTVAYAFLVLILTHTYTANLAAFLTVQQLDLNIHSVRDLRGKAVATIPTYVERLAKNHRISASTIDGWNYDKVIRKVQEGEYAAVISDDTQLIPRAYSDDSCSLHILKESVEPFDLALAFSKSFPSDAFQDDVSTELLSMQEDGTISAIRERYTPPEPRCVSEATEFHETNQVEISALWGLWIIMAGATAASIVAGVVEWAIKRRRKQDDGDSIGDRVTTFLWLVSGARHNADRQQAATNAVEAVCGHGALKPAAAAQHHPGNASAADDPEVTLGMRPTGLQPDPRRAFRHSSAGGRASRLSNRSHHSTISEECELPAPADNAINLSMHSIPSIGRASLADSASSNEGSGHGARLDAAPISLPGPPLSIMPEGAAQHAQHGRAGGAAGQDEHRAELAEVISMLRMVTERANALQGAPRVHV